MALNPLKLGVAVTNIYAPMHWIPINKTFFACSRKIKEKYKERKKYKKKKLINYFYMLFDIYFKFFIIKI